MKKRHINIPVFIPHLGCPNDCVFCNQRSISGKRSFDESAVKTEIETALSTVGEDCEVEIAFFGGSFTGIDRELMIRLLDTAQYYVNCGKVGSIRLSTRPDYIDDSILTILSRYAVRNIELGIQSMDDRVLSASRRGHTAADSERACRLVKSYGFSLVGQMMTGLPLSTPDSEIFTAGEICRFGVDGARIYPTMVFRRTELERMVLDGRYIPPEAENAVSRTAGALAVFVRCGVPVLRIGLHSGETLYSEEGISFGAYHPAMGELVEGELYFMKMRGDLLSFSTSLAGKTAAVSVPKGELSKAIGQKGRNRDRLMREFSLSHMLFREESEISKYRCEVKII